MPLKFVFISFLVLITESVVGQTARSPLNLTGSHLIIAPYVTEGEINIVALRKTTDFLTNRDIDSLNGLKLPKRKKAFIRHVKHLSERLEEYCFDGIKMDSTARELLVELEYFRMSFIRKAEFNANVNPSFSYKWKLVVTSVKTRRQLKYKISNDLIAEDLDSPYWSKVDGVQHKAFKKLASSKKVNIKQDMVVIFDDLSRGGSAPKIETLDLDLDNEWLVKWGDELHSDIVGSRIFAAIGYDVDHPYYYAKDKLTLIFDGSTSISNWEQLKDSVYLIYDIDVSLYYSNSGKVTSGMVAKNKRLTPYLGQEYVQFLKCGLEARPDRVKRLGSFLPNEFDNDSRVELRGALLLHAFIGNWDVKEDNTLLTVVHEGKYNYHLSPVFSDLGTSFGVKVNSIPLDFKVGLVNEFAWEVAIKKGKKVVLKNPINSLLAPYENATYADLKWMALKTAQLDSLTLRKCLVKAHWPSPIEELYFHKLVSRRASILKAFDIVDPHPIQFDKKITIVENDVVVIKNGKLKIDYDRINNPESFISKKGRNRNYGN